MRSKWNWKMKMEMMMVRMSIIKRSDWYLQESSSTVKLIKYWRHHRNVEWHGNNTVCRSK